MIMHGSSSHIALRPCGAPDFEAILAIINDGAQAYRGQIPQDCWHDPYMTAAELKDQQAAGVEFSGVERNGKLIGVMGRQNVQDVMLIRHAYVVTGAQRTGIGTDLLQHLCTQTERPILIGTWAAAVWAIRFYQKHGFKLVVGAPKDALLENYWTVPERQRVTSVVLADARWYSTSRG